MKIEMCKSIFIHFNFLNWYLNFRSVFILGFAQTYFATLVPESDNATTDTHWSEFLVVGLQRNVFAAVFENKLNFVYDVQLQ